MTKASSGGEGTDHTGPHHMDFQLFLGETPGVLDTVPKIQGGVGCREDRAGSEPSRDSPGGTGGGGTAPGARCSCCGCRYSCSRVAGRTCGEQRQSIVSPETRAFQTKTPSAETRPFKRKQKFALNDRKFIQRVCHCEYGDSNIVLDLNSFQSFPEI